MADEINLNPSSGEQPSSSDRMSFADRLLSSVGGQWGDGEQSSLLAILRAWMKMLEDEIREKQKTILEIFSRLNMHEEAIAQRVKSAEYQSLMKKAFRNWSGTESAKKQEYIRNILCNAAGHRLLATTSSRSSLNGCKPTRSFTSPSSARYIEIPAQRGRKFGRIGKG